MKARDYMGSKLTDPLRKQIQEILGNMGFGDGTSGKRAGNHAGIILSYTSNSVANTPDILTHGLGRIPTHVFPTLPASNAGASLAFVGADLTTLTISCNIANTTFKLYVE